MRALLAVPALLVGALLATTWTPPADAQGGLGRGRNRPSDKQAPHREQPPPQELAPGEYSFNGPDVVWMVFLAQRERSVESLPR